jgi:hypothetical protein
LWPLASEDFCSPLYRKFGLNATEEETRFLARDLTTEAMTNGRRAMVHRLSYWDRATQTLYVSLHDGTLIRLTGQQIEKVDNGTDNVLFLADAVASAVTPNLTLSAEPFHSIFENLSLAGDAEHRARMLAVLKVWVLAIFFFDALPVKPIVLLLGEQGAGKTTLGRRIGLVLFGEYFDVGSFKRDASAEQDFLAAITSTRFLVFDNADSRIGWLADHLAKLATGSIIQKRRLYTTNTLATFRPDCYLMMTSRDPKWTRDDVARRLLPIRMETITTAKLREGELQTTILAQRAEIWGSILSLLNGVVAATRQSQGAFKSNHRLADFHWFGSLAAPVIGLTDEFQAAMEKLDEEQLDVLADGNDRLELFQIWTDGFKDWPAIMTSADALKGLREVYSGQDRNFPFKGCAALGTWLGRSKDLIHSKLDIDVASKHTKVTRSWTFKKIRCHPVTDEKDTEDQRVVSGDTMTPQTTQKVSPDESGQTLYAEDLMEVIDLDA